MIDLHADDDVESDEEPPELTDSDDSDFGAEVNDYAPSREVIAISQAVFQRAFCGAFMNEMQC